MRNKLLKFFVVTLLTLTTGEILSNSCNRKEKRHKGADACETACGTKFVRQHRFAKGGCCPRGKSKNHSKAANQKANRKAKSCCG